MMKRQLFIIAVAALALGSIAANKAPKSTVMHLCSDSVWSHNECRPTVTYNALNAVDANTDAASRTLTVETGGFSKIVGLASILDADTDAGNLVMTYSFSQDNSLYGQQVSKSVATGTATLAAYTEQMASAGGTTTYPILIDCWGWNYVKMVFSVSGTSEAVDKITVQVAKTVGK
jgi:hypothetical protein